MRTAFEQPVWKERAVAQHRYRHIDRADTGVKVVVVDPFSAGDAVFGAAYGVNLGREDLVDKPLSI